MRVCNNEWSDRLVRFTSRFVSELDDMNETPTSSFEPHHHYLAVFLNNEVPADFNDRTDYDLWSGKPVLHRCLRFLSWCVSSEV